MAGTKQEGEGTVRRSKQRRERVGCGRRIVTRFAYLSAAEQQWLPIGRSETRPYSVEDDDDKQKSVAACWNHQTGS